MHFIPAVIPPEVIDVGYWFIFSGSKLAVIENENGPQVPCIRHSEKDAPLLTRKIYLGTIDGTDCFCGELATESVPVKFEFRELRSLFDQIDSTLYGIAGKAAQLIAWDRTHQFCGQCGEKTETADREYAKRCPKCGMMFYPRISPAVIVAIVKEGKILLARIKSSQMFSVLAGYVEAGESLEETVKREIAEEVSLQVKNIRYFASQPWAYSNALMVGFTAEYASGEIRPDGEEIYEAAWFGPDELPKIPGPMSIARKLIDWFVEKMR